MQAHSGADGHLLIPFYELVEYFLRKTKIFEKIWKPFPNRLQKKPILQTFIIPVFVKQEFSARKIWIFNEQRNKTYEAETKPTLRLKRLVPERTLLSRE